MTGFFEVRCTYCKHRYGYRGSVAVQPPCPKCKKAQMVEIHDAKMIQEFQEFLRQRKLKKQE